MGCCGDQRARASSRASAAVRAVSNPGTRQTPAARAVPVRYIGSRSVAVQGTVSRRTYTFRTPNDLHNVDARDVPGLLRTGYFRRS